MNNSRVHVKAQLGTEIRRFVLEPITYGTMEQTIIRLFSLNIETHSIRMQYLDEDEDLVTFSSDEELSFAVETCSPLRVHLQTIVLDSQVNTDKSSTPTPTSTPSTSKLNKKERKMAVLEKQLANLQLRLSDPSLPPWRAQKINHRIMNLEDRLSSLLADSTSGDSADDLDIPDWCADNRRGVCGFGAHGRGPFGHGPPGHFGHGPHGHCGHGNGKRGRGRRGRCSHGCCDTGHSDKTPQDDQIQELVDQRFPIKDEIRILSNHLRAAKAESGGKDTEHSCSIKSKLQDKRMQLKHLNQEIKALRQNKKMMSRDSFQDQI
jgi:hypothetical protein